MPASVPTGWPKREESWGRRRETGPSIEAGGWCYNQGTASGENATNGDLDDMGAGCKFTHAPTDATGSSTHHLCEADHPYDIVECHIPLRELGVSGSFSKYLKKYSSLTGREKFPQIYQGIYHSVTRAEPKQNLNVASLIGEPDQVSPHPLPSFATEAAPPAAAGPSISSHDGPASRTRSKNKAPA